MQAPNGQDDAASGQEENDQQIAINKKSRTLLVVVLLNAQKMNDDRCESKNAFVHLALDCPIVWALICTRNGSFTVVWECYRPTANRIIRTGVLLFFELASRSVRRSKPSFFLSFFFILFCSVVCSSTPKSQWEHTIGRKFFDGKSFNLNI